MKNDIIKLLNSNGIVYRINSKSATIEIPFVDENAAIKTKRCSSWYCKSYEYKGTPWKIELKGVHVKWVSTREEAEQLINVIESN